MEIDLWLLGAHEENLLATNVNCGAVLSATFGQIHYWIAIGSKSMGQSDQ